MPALPLGEAGKYVAAAYLVFLALVLIYVAIMAIRLATIQRDLSDVVDLLERDDPAGAQEKAERAGAERRLVFSGDERSEAE